MGDPSGQKAEGLELLALQVVPFDQLVFGDVRGDDPKAPAMAAGVDEREFLDEEVPDGPCPSGRRA
jgi:hypothetical protein